MSKKVKLTKPSFLPPVSLCSAICSTVFYDPHYDAANSVSQLCLWKSWEWMKEGWSERAEELKKRKQSWLNGSTSIFQDCFYSPGKTFTHTSADSIRMHRHFYHFGDPKLEPIWMAAVLMAPKATLFPNLLLHSLHSLKSNTVLPNTQKPLCTPHNATHTSRH